MRVSLVEDALEILAETLFEAIEESATSRQYDVLVELEAIINRTAFDSLID